MDARAGEAWNLVPRAYNLPGVPRLLRLPDRRLDNPFFAGIVQPVIGSHQLAVGTLGRPRVADVPRAAAIAQHDLVAPRLAVVAADTRADVVRLRPVSVRDRDAPVLQPHDARRIAALVARGGRRAAQKIPRRAVVLGHIGVDPVGTVPQRV